MTRGTNPPEDAIRQIVAQNIRAAREYAGLSQRDLSELAEIGQAYISQCEAGRWNVGIDNVAKIARATGVPAHTLLDPAFQPAKAVKGPFRS